MGRQRARQWAWWVSLAWLTCTYWAWAGSEPAGTPWPPPLAGPTASDRLLVIAPHCDDEVLATGGLIQQALAMGARVQVVIVTNGDAFKSAARRLARGRSPGPEDFVHLGRHRQRESLAGLAALGVKGRQVTFLGYPDGGLVHLAVENWDLTHPYTSTTTQRNRSPYANSFRPHAPYAGRAVVDDLKAIIGRFRPTLLALPHSEDRHSDHWATYGFGVAALYELGLEGRVHTLCYLIHKTGWSEPAAPDRKLLLPPDHTQAWQAFALAPAQQACKARAADCYQSQVIALGPVMREFLGPTEFYVSPPWQNLEVLPVTVDRGEARLRLLQLEPVIAPPKPEAEEAASGLGWVRAAVQGEQLRLVLRLEEPAAGGTCVAYLYPLLRGRVAPPRRYVLDPARPPAGAEVKVEGRLIEALLPWEAGAVGVMLAVEVRGPKQPPRRTRWAALRRP